MSKMNIYIKIQSINNTSEFIHVLTQIFELQKNHPEKYEIGYEKNFTIYIKDGKIKKPVIYTY
ncbi:hypothetical protein ACQPVA_02900 [Clostridium butyricum]|uniref:hypothetical protein n=1 Tax=Clostridium butyricum TaxID=1492 RepID=UPI003D33DF8A